MMQANAGGLDNWADIGESGLEWAIEADNLLRIKVKDGVLSAAMPDWEESMPVTDDSPAPPWAKDDIADKVTSVVIGEGITNIGNYAFYYNFNLENVTIPSSVTTIGEYAFSQTSELKNVQFVENSQLTTIGEGAFNGTALSSIEIPSSVTTISANAFKSCGIGSVTFGENSQLTTIGAYAFEGCSSLTSIELPNLLKTIGENAFEGCNCASFSAIEIPASVETIGEYAFFSCTSLSNVTFANGSKLTTIGEGAFQRCPANNITIPDSVTSIGKSAFLDCTNLTGITAPCTIKTNETNWKGCDATVNYTHPIKDGDDFCACHTTTNLSTCGDNLYYTLDEETGKLTIGLINPNETDKNKNAMPDWADNTTVPWHTQRASITSVEIKDDVTNIGFAAFCECPALTEVKIPESVTSIDGAAFALCSNLASVTFAEGSKLTTIDTLAFQQAGLTSITIPSEVTDIGLAAFVGCSNLKEINLGNNVENIGAVAFGETGLTSVTIPSSVKTLGDGAFAMCESLTEITFEGNVPDMDNSIDEYDVFGDVGTEATPVKLYYPKDNTSWETFLNGKEEVFEWRGGYFKAEAHIPWNKIEGTNLQWAIDEGKLTVELIKSDETDPAKNAMPEWSLLGDVPWDNQRDSITSVEIKEGVTSIGFAAFGSCSSLTSITIPDSVTSIKNAAFASCSSLTNITIPDSVTEIGTDVFWDCNNLSSITAPCTLMSSAVYWKEGCTAKVTYKHIFNHNYQNKCDCQACFTIEGKNLYYTLADNKLTIGLINPNETDKNKNAMPDWDPEQNKAPWDSDKASIKSVEIKDGVTHIGKCAFHGYTSVTELTIGNGVTSIGWNAFNNTRIESVIIPDSVTIIGDTAFGYNDALKSVVLGNNVETIADGAFMNTGLTSIVIPAKVTKIGHGAFYGDVNLKEIVFKGNYPQITQITPSPVELPDKRAFNGVGTEDSPAKLYYPNGNTTWAELLNDNTGTLKWEDGNFTPVAYEVIKDAEQNDTNLMWYLVNGKLTIDLINSKETDETKNAIPDCGSGNSWSTANMPWSSIRNSIKSVEIKNGVSRIGFAAFGECALESITIPGSVKSIGNYAFDECEKLETVSIAEGVESIGDRAFSCCESLTSVTIPESVTSIGMMAFYLCEDLTDVKLPENITSISESLFEGCSSFKSTDILDNIISIGPGAFAGTAIESLTIPESVTSIGAMAFAMCESLTEITFEGAKSSIEIGEDAFEAVGAEAESLDDVPILHYPKGDKSWEDFLADNVTNDVLSWEGGYFTVESCIIWKNITDTDLRWAFDGDTLCIDKQENPSSDNFDVPAFGDDAPWKDSIDKIRFVNISSSVTDVSDTSFKGFNGQAILVLENGYNGTMPTAIQDSTYDSFGGGQFIYSKSQLTGASLSLAGKIGINLSFYITEKNPTIIINDTTIEPADPNLTIKNNVYTYTLEVAPKDAYDDITFEVTKDSETIIAEDSYNVKDEYVDVVLEDKEHKTYSEDVYNMVRALDAYINSSRIYFNEVGEDEEIKGSISTALEGLNLSGLDGYAQNIPSESVEGVEYYGSSLILNSGVKLRHYIEIADYDNVKENIVIKLNDNAVENVVLEKASFTSNSHDVYYFETDEFNPKDFGTNVSVTYDDTAAAAAAASGAKKVIDNYSVLTFISLSLGNPETAAKELGTTCKSIYNYYLEAKDFKN